MSLSFRNNLEGNVYGRLKVIKFIPDNTRYTKWECLCECGNIKTFRAMDIVGGVTKSCGCLKKEVMEKRYKERSYLNKEEYINKKYGRLTILSMTKGDLYTIANCICDCGNTKSAAVFDILSGKIQSCGCLMKESLLRSHENRRLGKGVASFNSYYARYKDGAKKRNLEFNISKEEFKVLIENKCFYCGADPSNKIVCVKKDPIYINGIDRVDNNIGYTLKNVVTCCSFCNKLKLAHNIDDFILQIKKIYENLNLSRDESDIYYNLIHGEHHD